MSIASLPGAPTPYEVTGKIDELITQVNQNDTDIDAKISTSQKGASSGVASLDTATKVTAAQTSADIMTTSGTALTLTTSYAGKLVKCTRSSGTCTITIPSNTTASLPVDTEIEIVRYGAGEVTISPASGVTLYSKDSARSIASRYGAVSLKKMGTNEWWMVGDLE